MGLLPVIETNKASAFALIKRASPVRESLFSGRPRCGNASRPSSLGSRIDAGRRGASIMDEKTDGPLLSFHLRFVNLSTETYRVGEADRAVKPGRTYQTQCMLSMVARPARVAASPAGTPEVRAPKCCRACGRWRETQLRDKSSP